MEKPRLSYWQIWNMTFGFLGVQIGFALQNGNVSRIFQELGASIDELPLLWLASPLTGFLVQPLIGHFSDRTWGPLGRRRPYFLAGAILTFCALVFMPNSPTLWAAAIGLWLLDASLNVTMEPLRAFVGDNLPNSQRALGYGMQTVFIGTGAVLASFAPFILTEMFNVSNVAPEGKIPDSIRYSFYLGAVALLAAMVWTIVRSREYPPAQLARHAAADSGNVTETLPPARPRAFLTLGLGAMALGLGIAAAVFQWRGDQQLYVLGFGIAALGLMFAVHFPVAKREAANPHAKRSFLFEILSDLLSMPVTMRGLAMVQFFSWVGLFLMWIYLTPAIAAQAFGATGPKTPEYAEAGNWAGVLAGTYNGIAGLYAFAIPWLARNLGERRLHAINLLAGAAGFASIFVISDPQMLLLSMVGIGMAWGSILSLPYALLSGSLPAGKMGVYMGIFNFFIVLPQIMVAGIMGPIMRNWFNGDARAAFLCAAGAFGLAALLTLITRGMVRSARPAAA